MDKETWIPEFIRYSPAYEIFNWLPSSLLSLQNWPTLAQYNELALIRSSVANTKGVPIQFIKQTHQREGFANGYEPRIYLKGEVQTRCKNWHDFFNMLIWHTFPRIKSHLNHLQYRELRKRIDQKSPRSALENFLTLFDENGLIIVSTDMYLLELIRDMNWKEVFWHQRDHLTHSLRCFVLGHSLHEKLLTPYVGLVGHALLLKIDENFFSKTLPKQLEEAETQCLALNLHTLTSHSFSPIPILGFPNWSPLSADSSFYENKNYFRSNKRRPEIQSNNSLVS